MRQKKISEDGFQLIAQRFAVLGEPTRLKLLHALFDGEKNVNRLVELTGCTQANVSRHLQRLMAAGAVARRRDAQQAFYSITDPTLLKLCELVCGSLEKQLAAQASVFK
jgi:ArsR family transcriptional regulator